MENTQATIATSEASSLKGCITSLEMTIILTTVIKRLMQLGPEALKNTPATQIIEECMAEVEAISELI